MIPFFTVKYKNGALQYYCLGLCIFSKKDTLSSIKHAVATSQSFNLASLDAQLAEIAENIYQKHLSTDLPGKTDAHRIGFLATELYKSGGHTECIKTLVSLLNASYKIYLFLTKKQKSLESAPENTESIARWATIDGVNYNDRDFENRLISLFRKVCEFSPKVLIVFSHLDDVLSAALLALIHRHTPIKILFFNHGSHTPSLGFSFADLILEGMPATMAVTKNERQVDKCHVIGLPSRKKEDTQYFAPNLLQRKRSELGVQDGQFCTLSSGAAYKFFESKNASLYFEMMKRVLATEANVHHVVISNFNKKQRKIIDRIFYDAPELIKRITFLPLASDFDLLFQSCDLYIDTVSFSSALTQIDIMRNKRPTIVKINIEKPLQSFHEYLPKDYPYMYIDVGGMETGIHTLLHSKAEQIKATQMLYNHYLAHYEGKRVLDRYVEIIENVASIARFYE